MPNSDGNKLIVKLVPCSRCGNPFMVKMGQKGSDNKVCDNCIKLEKRKKELANSVMESQKELEASITDLKHQMIQSKAQQRKNVYKEEIERKSKALTRSIELLKKIEETNDEKYIEEYKALFEKLKRESFH